jgi:HTH-type transcriptional regulator, cell division transcriptional repressor
MQDKENVGATLRAAREAAGLTQVQLAKKLGVSQASVHGWERRHDPRVSTLRRVAKALGLKLVIKLAE